MKEKKPGEAKKKDVTPLAEPIRGFKMFSPK